MELNLKSLSKFYIFLFFPLIFHSQARAISSSKNRVEELFIWKISDELSLSVPEEKSFSKLVRELNLKRNQTNEKIQANLKSLAASANPKEQEKLLNEQKKLLKSYGEIPVEEIDKVQKMFGPKKATHYFVLKNEMASKLKLAFSSPDRLSNNGTEVMPSEAAQVKMKLPPPQVFEEK